MQKKTALKNPSSTTTTIVRKHLRHIIPSKRNPTGITAVRQHIRHISSFSLTAEEIRTIASEYQKKGLIYPNSNDLGYKNGKKFDEIIAIWVDYFNSKLTKSPSAPLDPNVIKALIASESDFRLDPKNPKAIGVAQITPATYKILLNPNGETKEFIFKEIRQKDLKEPEIAIPLAVRWIFRKKDMATATLKRIPSPEEIILDYKGLLLSKTTFKQNALKKFKKHYATLTKK